MGTRKLPESLLAVLLCLLVVMLGMRVPNISRPHSPKPHSRAIIENVGKASQETVKKTTLVVAELTEAVQVLAPDWVSFSPLHKPLNVTCRHTSSACRAPPFLSRS